MEKRDFIKPMLEITLRDLVIHTVELLDWEIGHLDDGHHFIYRNQEYLLEEMCVDGLLDLLYWLNKEI